VRSAVAGLARNRTGVFWVREMLPIGELREILSAATVFVCPSVYEPLGIVNLEAMACATAVVASDVGGIPEAVADGITGSLVHYDADDPIGYQARLAGAVNELIADPERANRYGQAGRQRCIEEFSWAQVAEQTLEIYQKVCA
jgi:starch synthase